MAIQELAWSGNLAKIKLKQKPNLHSLYKYRKELSDALRVMSDWYCGSSAGKDTKKFVANLRVIVALFGFEPYEGPLFRAIPYVKQVNKKTVHEGDVKRLKATVRPISSWTTSLSNATKYGHEKHGDFVVIQLKDKGMQLMNSVFLRAVVDWLIAALKTAKAQKYKPKGDLAGFFLTKPKYGYGYKKPKPMGGGGPGGYGGPSKYKKGPGKVHKPYYDDDYDDDKAFSDIQYNAQDLRSSLDEYRDEDEVIVMLKKRSQVQIKLVVGERIVRRRA